MKQRAFIKTTLLVTWIAITVWFGVGSLQAQKPLPANTYSDEHAKTNPARPDKQVSDLTKDVAGKLAHLGANGQKIVVRNLIDQHLFGQMAQDKIPHAPLSNDYEFCRHLSN
jgi:hypothetical protein